MRNMIRYAGTTMTIRQMSEHDWPEVSRILAEGIATKVATFRSDVPAWVEWNATHLRSCRLVAQSDAGAVIGWAALSAVSSRASYRGVAEVSIYVGSANRGTRVGTGLLEALAAASEQAGFWTLQAVILVMNHASIALHQRCGFRIVGRRERIGRLPDGTWCDTLLLERRSSRVFPG